MARSIWKGAISFGLVHIPVQLYTAVSDSALDLTMLDKRDFSPIGFRRYNKASGKEVKWENIIKGYEYQADEFVVLSDEDLKQANVKKTQTIDIAAFVDAAEVPLIYYEQPYYLAPDRGGDKVYALLRETLRKAGKVAIAEIVIHTKQHLCALLAMEDVIVLNTLRYADEIRAMDDLNVPGTTLKAVGITDKEMAMAMSLVDGLSEPWDPAQYRDSYREDVLALVEKKVKAGQTKTITMPSDEDTAAPAGSNVVDLVALLQQSLGKRVPSKPAQAKTVSAKSAPARSAAKPAPRKAGVAGKAAAPAKSAAAKPRAAPKRRLSA